MRSATSIAGDLPSGSGFYIAIATYNRDGESGPSNILTFTIPAAAVAATAEVTLGGVAPIEPQSCSVDNSNPFYA